MQKTTVLSPVQLDLPIELQHLRVAVCWRSSTKQEEQSGGIELQKWHYTWLISPNWENACIFSEQTFGLNLQERPECRRMVKLCQKKKIDMVYNKIHQPLRTQYTGYAVDTADSK